MNINIYVELQKMQLYILSQNKLNFFSVQILKKIYVNSLTPTYLGTTSSLLFEEDSIKIKRD